MHIKDKFELVYGRHGAVFNIVPLNSRALNTYAIPKEDTEYLKNLVRMYIRTRSSTVGTDFVLRNMDKCVPIRIDDYPLPAFMSRDRTPYVNLNVLQQTTTTDFAPPDIYAIYLNSLVLSYLQIKQPITLSSELDVSNYIYSVFMKLFGKKSGLLGSYKDLIPKLRFLVSLYVRCGMFGEQDTDRARKQIAASLYTSFDDLKMDYDFSSTNDFIKCIRDNQIIPLSTIKFSQQIVRIGGPQSLPIFEDNSRFFSTLICSLVSGNAVYTSFWSKMPGTLYKKIVYKTLKYISRG